MLACKASLSSTASSNMLRSTMLSKGFVSSSMRQLSSSTVRLGGQKAKRRKQTLRADNPHLPVRALEKTPTSAALAHFDDFYSSVFKSRWASMRLALLCPGKHCALVNNFGDSEATVDRLEELGCVNIGTEFLKEQQRLQPYLGEGGRVVAEGAKEEELVKEQEEEEKEAKAASMLEPGEETKRRLVAPEERVMGAGASPALFDFMPATELKGMDDFVEEGEYYSYKKVGRREVRVVEEASLTWPPALTAYTFPRGVVEPLPAPKAGLLGTLGYYCMDAASLLPVIALDLKPGVSVLDMCSGPGGKALAMLQTLTPASLVCNDVNHDRVRRVIRVLDQYMGREAGGGIGGARNAVTLTRQDGSQMMDYESYDRVLVDAPCYTDRHAVNSDESNVFMSQQMKDRLKMPEKQAELLKTGLTLLKPGGVLVYSTCTLSPIQNDGVVHMALSSLWEETSLNFEVCDLSQAVKPLRFLCKIQGRKEGIKYGQLVVPNLPANFGPMYFAKIRRMP